MQYIGLLTNDFPLRNFLRRPSVFPKFINLCLIVVYRVNNEVCTPSIESMAKEDIV